MMVKYLIQGIEIKCTVNNDEKCSFVDSKKLVKFQANM